ncbi:MAG: MBL fold metallo-hydrolase [Planctomycetota bacterium]
MLFERFEDELLSHYSFLIGCPSAGVAAVVDPKRDVHDYLERAEANGVRITHVLETHIPADYASGAKELSELAGAELALSSYDAGETYDVSYPHRELHDGDRIDLGGVRLQAIHTPGHTPEHLSFAVYDLQRSDGAPLLLLSGDFLFVGSLGRPDLLGDEAKHALAGQLYDSVHERLTQIPDGTEVHPAHGAGSL